MCARATMIVALLTIHVADKRHVKAVDLSLCHLKHAVMSVVKLKTTGSEKLPKRILFIVMALMYVKAITIVELQKILAQDKHHAKVTDLLLPLKNHVVILAAKSAHKRTTTLKMQEEPTSSCIHVNTLWQITI